MTDLDRIQQLAGEAARDMGRWPDRDQWATVWDLETCTADYVAALDPKTVQELVMEIRTLRADNAILEIMDEAASEHVYSEEDYQKLQDLREARDALGSVSEPDPAE